MKPDDNTATSYACYSQDSFVINIVASITGCSHENIIACFITINWTKFMSFEAKRKLCVDYERR